MVAVIMEMQAFAWRTWNPPRQTPCVPTATAAASSSPPPSTPEPPRLCLAWAVPRCPTAAAARCVRSGLKPLDAAGNVVPLGGGSLAEVVSLDVSGLDPRLTAVRFRIAVDVQNPLFGSDGAAHVFGPQKGADQDAVELLDAGLRNWASLLRDAGGQDVNVPGAGAAGGFPASFLAFTQATLEGGFALVAGLTGLPEQLDGADLVITGEGSMDSQSLTGKAPIASRTPRTVKAFR